MSGEIAKQEQKAPAKRSATIEEAIARNADAIEAALDGAMTTEKFVQVCATVYRNGGDRMKKADWPSVMLSMIEAAQLELTPGGVLGECYIIPRRNNRAGRMEANFQLGYRGAMKLARRGGAVRDIQAEVVREKDDFRITLGTSRGIHHVPHFGTEDPGPIIGAYATAVLADGSVVFRAITKKEIYKAKAASGDPRDPSKISDAWRDHEPAMARKTAIHRLVKYLPIPDKRAKEAIIRDEYREAGIGEDKVSPHPHALRRQLALSEPGVEERRAYDDLVGKVWTHSNPFWSSAGIQRHRETQEGRDLQNTLIMWLANSQEDWPDAEDRDGRIHFLRLALAALKRWKSDEKEDRLAVCDEFAEYLRDKGIAAKGLKRLPPLTDEERAEQEAEERAAAQFENDQAAAETFGDDEVNF